MRTFKTGATRDSDNYKFDYEGFLSPLVIKRFGAYMHRNRKQTDGNLRDSDNWQKGISKEAYMKSAYRHFMDWWTIHRGYKAIDFENKEVELQEALCGLLFNVMGYLYEDLRRKK